MTRLSRQQREILAWIADKTALAVRDTRPESRDELHNPSPEHGTRVPVPATPSPAMVQSILKKLSALPAVVERALAETVEYAQIIARIAVNVGVAPEIVDDSVQAGKLDFETLRQWDQLLRAGMLDRELARAIVLESSIAAYAYWDASEFLGRSPTTSEKSSLSRALRSLWKRGYVRRRRKPGQKQKRLVRLTYEGIRALERG